jgi:catalase (peroxidase I)
VITGAMVTALAAKFFCGGNATSPVPADPPSDLRQFVGRLDLITSPRMRPHQGRLDAEVQLREKSLRARPEAVVTSQNAPQSQDWWPADYGTYAPFFIRLAWQRIGTYRVGDEVAAELAVDNSVSEPSAAGPTATRTATKPSFALWPVKKKYGNQLSWADSGSRGQRLSLESMGFKTFGFRWRDAPTISGNRSCLLQGPERKNLADERHSEPGVKALDKTTRRRQMGLIYTSTQRVRTGSDPLLAANIRRKL